MKNLRLQCCAGILVLTFALFGIQGSAFAGMFLPYGMTYGTGWFDANKTVANTEDDLMCWAASASNILTWGGWTTPAFSDEDSIFQQFQDHWTDLGGMTMFGWEWWIDGNYSGPTDPGWSAIDVVGGGNYFSGLDPWDYIYREWQDDLAMSAIDTYLNSGLGVSIGIYGPGGHALTVWGYQFDDTTGDYTGLIFSDSDDYMSVDGSERDLWLTGLSYTGGQWFLGGSDWYIGEVQALAPYATANPIPEPTSLLLFGTGIGALGLVVYRCKRK